MTDTVLPAGASGEVGKRLVGNLIADNSIGEIHLLTRRPLSINHKKVVEHIVEFNSLGELNFNTSFDHAFCCLGTTIKQAGSQQAFYHVDFDYCVQFAELASKHQCRNLSIISSLGANPNSNNFYLQTKGKMEKSIQALGWHKLLIFRPSLLTGPRAEFRTAEVLGGYLMKLITPLMVGQLKQYRPIQMDTVAKAMASANLPPTDGISIIESSEIQKLGQ